MANSITPFQVYIDNLDEVYQRASCSAVLDTDPNLITAGKQAGEYVVPKISMDGLGDYDRNSGYVSGSVNLTYETKKADYDRGRKFSVDAVEDEDTAGVAFGTLSSEFVRTKSTPELDAYRFAKYAKVADAPKEETLADGAAVLKAIRVAMDKMDENQVPEESRYLFITPTLMGMIDDLDTTKSKEVLKRLEGRIVKVPQVRFYTAIDLKNGKLGEATGGYEKASVGGKNINFLIIDKTAVMQFSKHLVNKVISPKENQDADAWAFFYRSHGMADVYENKVVGVYMNNAPEA